MRVIRHLVAETAIYVCLLNRGKVTVSELVAHLNAFNTIRPTTRGGIQTWLDGCNLSENSNEQEKDLIQDFNDEISDVAVLWCPLEHYLRVRRDVGHMLHSSGSYIITLKGQVYFEARRKQLEFRRTLPAHRLILDG